MIQIDPGKFLHCNNSRNICEASMAYDWRGLRHRAGRSGRGTNAKVVVDASINITTLVTTSIIPANTEMLWEYEDVV
jgi:hypothetical protein